MKREKCPAGLLREAREIAEGWRKPPPYRPRYTLHEAGEWIEFPPGWREVDILPFCSDEHRLITPRGPVVKITINGETIHCHSVMFSNGDVWDAFNLGIRREIIYKRKLRELSARYLLPKHLKSLIGLSPYQRAST